MPELVASGPDAFVKAAAALGNGPAALGQLEAAFAEMYRRYRAQIPPASFGL